MPLRKGIENCVSMYSIDVECDLDLGIKGDSHQSALVGMFYPRTCHTTSLLVSATVVEPVHILTIY